MQESCIMLARADEMTTSTRVTIREKGLQMQHCQVYGPHSYNVLGCKFYILCVWSYKDLPGWTLSPLCLWHLSLCENWISLVKGLSCLVLSCLILSCLVLSANLYHLVLHWDVGMLKHAWFFFFSWTWNVVTSIALFPFNCQANLKQNSLNTTSTFE